MVGAMLTLLIFPARLAPTAPEGNITSRVRHPYSLNALYLPLISDDDRFKYVPAIWDDTAPVQAYEVALFRHSFTTTMDRTGLKAQVFADTRYELWLDGIYIGRGPARFSKNTHEYDEFAITSTLASGQHVLAALVQWSPDSRRSESERPILQAQLYGGPLQGQLEQTGTNWKALRSPAWNANASPVYPPQSLPLIGRTELLDLRSLPAHWMNVGFDDSAWAYAVTQHASSAHVQPRSIPLLAYSPMTFSVSSSGKLASGFTLTELQPGQTITVDAPYGGQLTLHTLANPTTQALVQTEASASQVGATCASQAAAPILASTDGATGLAPAWISVSDWHCDIRQAAVTLAPGRHMVTFRNVPAGGWPVLASFNGNNLVSTNISQGTHAGRRLLLSQPLPAPGIVQATPAALTPAGTSDYTLNLNFTQPDSYAVLDLGRVVYGRLNATVSGGTGTVIDIGWDERVWQGFYPLPYPGSLNPQWNQTDSWVLDGTDRHISTIDARAGRYVLIAVWGTGPVQMSGVRVIEEHYPVDLAVDANFGDPQLNKIWRVGRDTVMLNMRDAYADPWRERGQWWGDATVDDAVNEVTFKDNQLMRRGLLFMSEQFRNQISPAMTSNGSNTGDLLDYGMLWVQGVQRYVSRTGDMSVLNECYPAVKAFMQHLKGFQNPGTELLDIPVPVPTQMVTISALIDWSAYYSPYGHLSLGQSAPLNALYYGTLQDASILAHKMNDVANETDWATHARALRNSINAKFYLPDQGRYGTILVGRQALTPTVFAQAWPLAYGIVPDDNKTSVVKALLELSKGQSNWSVQPYGMYWVLMALGDTGHVQDGIDLIKAYYGYMLDRGATTWWETLDADHNYAKALSHGWGSAPTWFLSTYVPTVPGS